MNKCIILVEKEFRFFRNEGLGYIIGLIIEISRGGSRGWGYIRMNSGGGKKWVLVVVFRLRVVIGIRVFLLNFFF